VKEAYKNIHMVYSLKDRHVWNSAEMRKKRLTFGGLKVLIPLFLFFENSSTISKKSQFDTSHNSHLYKTSKDWTNVYNHSMLY